MAKYDCKRRSYTLSKARGVLLTVQDNGCDIAASDLPHIFLSGFFSIPHGSRGNWLGAGRALNPVEGVLGSIEVSSGAAGTVVTLHLPQDCGTHTDIDQVDRNSLQVKCQDCSVTAALLSAPCKSVCLAY